MTENIKLLGVKDKWWILRVIVLSPLWLLYINEKGSKKSWKQFKYGLIKHKCEFDYNNPETDKHGSYYPCKNYGCNIVTTRDINGKFEFEK